MKALRSIGLLLLSALLLFLAWPPHILAPFAFIALVPLLFYFDSVSVRRRIVRFLLFFAGALFVLFVFGYSTSFNAWGEYDDNVHTAVFMSVWPEAFIIALAAFIRRKSFMWAFMIVGWASSEVLQTTWEMNAPLFMLGNSLSTFPGLIQHYSVWGVIGGSMQIFAINVFVFYILKKWASEKKIERKPLLYLGLLFIPTIVSIITYNFPANSEKTIRVGVVIGHFDHFKKEYSENPEILVDKYNELSAKIDLDKVDFVVYPESAVVNGGWIENLNANSGYNPLDSLCPGKDIFFGSHMFAVYKGADTTRYDIRHHPGSQSYYSSHNCIVFRNEAGKYTVRSKEKFVPFHEAIPYPSVFLYAKDWYNKDEHPNFIAPYPKAKDGAFKTTDRTLVNPLMCFESTFSDMAIRNNEAGFVLVLANESWNSEERGKRQYVDYLRAKAIESGKSFLKVSNGGYSGVIDNKGRISKLIGFDQPTTEIVQVSSNSDPSIYSRISAVINSLVVLLTFSLFLSGIFLKNRKV